MHFWRAGVQVRQPVVVFHSKIYHVRWQPQADSRHPRSRHEFPERTGHALGLCMEVAHGGFETVVTEHDLEIADEGTVLQRMGGKGMAQVMRRDPIELTPVGGLLDGPLHVGFVAAPAHNLFGAGMQAGGARGEEPGPTFGMGGVRIFLGEEIRQGDRDALGLIRRGEGLGDDEWSGQGSRETLREPDDPAFLALGLLDVESGLGQIEVLDAEIKGFGDAESASVEEVDDEAGRVTMHVGHRSQQLADFVHGGTIAKDGRSSGAEGINGPELLVKNLAVKEEQGAKGLVVGRGGNAGAGQHGEEGLHFLFGGLGGESSVLEKEAVALDPVGVGLLGAEREVFSFTSFYC